MSKRQKFNEQLELPIAQHGGKRKGAGRKKRTQQAPHTARPRVIAHYPLHITMKLRPGLSTLRDAKLMRQSLDAFDRVKKFGLRVIHFTLQSNHIHLLCEADSNEALERGMKSLAVSLAKVIQRLSGLSGAIFPERFNMHVLKSPTEARNAIKYILFNLAKHSKVARNVDPYSSIYTFEELEKLLGGSEAKKLSAEMVNPPRWIHRVRQALAAPGSWLLKVGWRRARH